MSVELVQPDEVPARPGFSGLASLEAAAHPAVPGAIGTPLATERDDKIVQPEKVGFALELDASSLAALPQSVQDGLQAVAAGLNESGMLWKWRAFPAQLPPSVLERGQPVKMNQLFPVAHIRQTSQAGWTRAKLDRTQRRAVRRTGTFEADSGLEEVPNVWTVSRLVQTGTRVLQEYRYKILAMAYGVQRFSWPRLLFSGFDEDYDSWEECSCFAGMHDFFTGVRHTVDLFVGWRWMVHKYSKYDIDNQMENLCWKRIVATLRAVYGRDGRSSGELVAAWRFTDASGQVHNLDFSFHITGDSDRSVQPNKLHELDKQLTRQRREQGQQTEPWLPAQLKALRESDLPPVLQQVFVVEHSLASADQSLRLESQAEQRKIADTIQATYPIRRFCRRFRQHMEEVQLDRWRKRVEQENGGLELDSVRIKLALRALQASPIEAKKLAWWIHILEQRLAFKSSAEATAERKALERITEPMKTRSMPFRIWRPKNWIIKAETVGMGQARYHAQIYTNVKVTTRYPGWRLWAFVVFCACAAKNGCFGFLCNMFFGPLGLQALVWPTAFYPATRVNSNTGELEVDPNVCIESLCSRLTALWSAIADSREKFESAPDRGLLGKSVTRIFNLVWNYLFLGFLGTVQMVVAQPLLTFVNVLFSLLLFFTPFIWAPLVAILSYFCCILLYDPLCASNDCSIFGFFVGLFYIVLGIVRFIVCFLLLFLLPILNVLLLLLRLLGNALWWMYDGLMYCLVLRTCARVPGGDSFLARRTAGPGLAASFYYQISPAVAIVALQYQLEMFELELNEARLQYWAQLPVKQFEEAVNRFFIIPLGLNLSQLDGNNKKSKTKTGQQDELSRKFSSIQQRMGELQAESAKDIKRVREAYQERRQVLQQRWERRYRQVDVRQSEADAQRLLRTGTTVVKAFAERRWLPLMTEKAALDMWDKHNLAPGDWKGLTQSLLEDEFSTDFFTMTLDKADKQEFFRLEVTHTGLGDLVTSLVEADSSIKDPLTKVTPVCPQVREDAPAVEPTVMLGSILPCKLAVPDEVLRRVRRQDPGWGLAAEPGSGLAAEP